MKIPNFQFHTIKEKSAIAKKFEWLKNDVNLFSRLYVANQLREGDMGTKYPPFISDQGILRSSKV